MPQTLRVLILEDREEDARQVLRQLCIDDFEPEWERATTVAEMEALLDETWDVILADYGTPEFGALRGLRVLQERQLNVPFLVVSGQAGEDLAVEAMKQGADDYLLKDRLGRLGQAVRDAVQRRQTASNRWPPLGSSTPREEAADLEYAKEANRRLAAILESTPDFVALTDVDGEMFYINRSGREMVGWSKDDEADGEREYGYLSDFHPRWAIDLLSRVGIPQALRDGFWSGETALRHRTSGVEIPVSQTVLAHRSASGQVAYLSTIARDISRQKDLEEQIRQAQKMEAVGRLAGGVAHDFNNIFTIILGYSDLIQEKLSHDQSNLHLIQGISEAARRAAVLTRQLLAFSRKQVLQPCVINLNTSIRDAEPILRQLVGEDIQLVTDLAGDLWDTKADPGQIEQVILNLAINAREAMPQGGTLHIETRNSEIIEEDAVKDRELVPGEYVTLRVTDAGMGMDLETLAHIFEPFFTTKETGAGTGLGLAMVYGVVKQSEGHVQVESELGKGTKFSIYLPRYVELPRNANADPHPPGTHAREISILLVEDDEAVRRLARYALQVQGYQVFEAANGREALQMYDALEKPMDVLLTDVIMPYMNGRELAERLLVRQPSLDVIYMSGYSDDAMVQRKLLDSTGSFLQKPFTPASLLSKLREVLAKRDG
jgi:two-component system, cell cycle sensor histidine kinase and response regulator CckA